MKNFDDFLKDNPDLIQIDRQPYWAKTLERKEQFKIAVEKVELGYPRKAVIKWLQDECKWTIAFKTISDYIGENVKQET